VSLAVHTPCGSALPSRRAGFGLRTAWHRSARATQSSLCFFHAGGHRRSGQPCLRSRWLRQRLPAQTWWTDVLCGDTGEAHPAGARVRCGPSPPTTWTAPQAPTHAHGAPAGSTSKTTPRFVCGGGYARSRRHHAALWLHPSVPAGMSHAPGSTGDCRTRRGLDGTLSGGRQSCCA